MDANFKISNILNMDELAKKMYLETINEHPVKGEGGLIHQIKIGGITLEEMIEAGLDTKKAEEVNSAMAAIKEKEAAEMAALQEKEAATLSKQTHYDNVNSESIDVEEFRDLINEGKLTREELLANTNMTEDEFNKIKTYHKNETPFSDWDNLPEPAGDATDLYFFGVAGSGKSCMLASLFHYADKYGLIIETLHSPAGTLYRNQLVSEIKHGVLPVRTEETAVNYMPIDLYDPRHPGEDSHLHPLNFIEMSGEKVSEAYKNGINGQEAINAKNYLANDNKKLIFFVLDYAEHLRTQSGESRKTPQDNQLLSCLLLLHQFGTLHKTDGIYIIITKSDLFPDGCDKDQFAQEFLKNHYLTFLNNCKKQQKEYDNNFKIVFYPYSLGTVRFGQLLTNFDEKSAYDVLEYICDASFKKGKKSAWF